MIDTPSFSHISMPSIFAVVGAAIERFALFQAQTQLGIMGDAGFGKGNFLVIDSSGTGSEIRDKISQGLVEEAITLSSQDRQDTMVLYHIYDLMSDKHARVLLENFHEAEEESALHTLIFPKSEFLKFIYAMRQCASERQTKQRVIHASAELA